MHKYQKQLPSHHIPWVGIMRDGTKDENLTSRQMDMSRQQIITFRPVVTYTIASRVMNNSLVAKLLLNAPLSGSSWRMFHIWGLESKK